ncbi:MAG: hypothetical protein Q8P22_03000, partial [Chloroflexota bacterium]|nr:hypothetical protein [Chloroflexota bacterium]
MQDRYVGDLGDFGKYALLKSLCSSAFAEPELRLGVVWYLVADERKGNDGRYTDYLKDTGQNGARFRRCDPSLYDALRRIVHSEQRGVLSVRTGGVLPTGTAFYEEPLTFKDVPVKGRLPHRSRWLRGA